MTITENKQKPEKLPFFQICLNFPKKLALKGKKFLSDHYILIKGKIRKIIQQTHFWTF